MYINLMRVGGSLELQLLMPAHDYCLTILEDDNSAQITCILPDQYTFLITEAEGSFSTNLKIVNLIEKSNGATTTLVSFAFTPIKIKRLVLTQNAWLPGHNNIKELLFDNSSDPETILFLLHFDFRFYPPLNKRGVLVGKNIKFILCYEDANDDPVVLIKKIVYFDKLISNELIIPE